MNTIKPSQDIVPLSDFRARVSELLQQTQLTGRPIVITQHGRGTGVLVSAEQYGTMIETIETLRGIVHGQTDAMAGRTAPHEQVMEELDALIGRASEAHRKPTKRGKKPSRRKVAT